jgi:hypothetical protein
MFRKQKKFDCNNLTIVIETKKTIIPNYLKSVFLIDYILTSTFNAHKRSFVDFQCGIITNEHIKRIVE